MHTQNLDIVYCVKPQDDHEDLRYSLRSLENLPHNKVWIFGEVPDWCQNVEKGCVTQVGDNKWDRTASSLWEIANTNAVSEDFIWFNDDFFILKPVEKLEYSYDRTLPDRVRDFEKNNRWGFKSRYAQRLELASQNLKANGHAVRNYELHLPIIFNRDRLKQIIQLYRNLGAKRSLYCNHYGLGGVERSDVKIYTSYETIPKGQDFLSTSDASFAYGKVGRELRTRFNKKSIYER